MQIKSEIAVRGKILGQIKTAPWKYIGAQYYGEAWVPAGDKLWLPVGIQGLDQLHSEISDQITTDIGEFNV